jgi:sodium-dependent dicarboxylate transporter 2/3/5
VTSTDPAPEPGPLAYRDSRRAAYRILGGRRRHVLVRLLLFVVVAALAWWAWHALTAGFTPEQRVVLFLFVLAVGLWVTEAVPAFAVGLLIMGFLVFALGSPLLLEHPRDASMYLDTWSSPVIWLMLGGFFMAEGLARTGLDQQLFALAIKPAGTQPARVLLAVMLTTAVASMFISNTSTTALMISAVLPFVRNAGPKEPFTRALMVGIPLAASLGGMGTIIGSAPNAIAAGVAEEFGQGISFLQWMAIGAPLALVLVLAGWWFLLRRYPPVMQRIDASSINQQAVDLTDRRARLVVAGITLVTVLLWLTTPLHGIHVAAISLIPIVGLTMSQVLGAAQVRGLPWDTLMLVAGGLSLGAAVVDTGLAERMASGLQTLIGMQSDLLVFACLSLLTVMLSNFMSNTATVSLMLPVAVAMVPGRELEMCLVLGLSASCALMLPVSTPPNAVAYSSGLIKAADLRASGLLTGLLGPALILLWVLGLAALWM